MTWDRWHHYLTAAGYHYTYEPLAKNRHVLKQVQLGDMHCAGRFRSRRALITFLREKVTADLRFDFLLRQDARYVVGNGPSPFLLGLWFPLSQQSRRASADSSGRAAHERHCQESQHSFRRLSAALLAYAARLHTSWRGSDSPILFQRALDEARADAGALGLAAVISGTSPPAPKRARL
jgi:hypothetical protein